MNEQTLNETLVRMDHYIRLIAEKLGISVPDPEFALRTKEEEETKKEG